MQKYYLNKYRIETTRLKTWNYGKKGLYYITINTKFKYQYLGKIIDGRVHLSEIGMIAEQEWLKTPSIRPDMNLTLKEFVIMPNHIHAIIKIGTNVHNDAKMHIFEPGVLKKRSLEFKGMSPQSKNLSSIVRGFKSAVKAYALNNHIDFEWHPRFYDNVIRHGLHYSRIRKYILDNPARWASKHT